jgi:hypothetical protein
MILHTLTKIEEVDSDMIYESPNHRLQGGLIHDITFTFYERDERSRPDPVLWAGAEILPHADLSKGSGHLRA